MEKIKFEDLSGGQDSLKVEELAALEGGQLAEMRDGCSSGVCNEGREVGAQFCVDAVCTSGLQRKNYANNN